MSPRHALLVFAVWVAGQAAPSPAPAADLAPVLERRWAAIEKKAPKLGVREVMSFALEAAAADWRPDRVEQALAVVEQMQNRDAKSKTYGNFKWYWGDDGPIDLNAVEFTVQQGVVLRMRYRDRLTAKARETLDHCLDHAEHGIQSHKVDVSYTNIFLMKCWNLIALGEALHKEPLARDGYQAFDRWLDYTKENGVHEYLSPTYYGTDLDSLGLIARFAQRPEGRQKAENALLLFWVDIAANWYEPGQRLGGAHSRDYDYLAGHGELDTHLTHERWIKPREETRPAFVEACAWAPPAVLHERLARGGPRLVQQRWGPDQTATQYVGRRVSVGSATAAYNNMDKPLTVNLPGGPAMPMLSFFMDGRGDPYGHRKITEANGHSKSLHLIPFLTSVQKGPEVLLLASSTRGAKGSGVKPDDLACLLSHVVLPADGELWVGANRLPPAKDDKPRPVPAGETVVLRLEDVAVAVKFVLALGPNEGPASVVLVEDGGEYRARRLTCVHSAEKPTGKGTAAVWVRVAEGLDDAGFKAFLAACGDAHAKTAVDGDDVTVEVGKLRLRADLAKEKTVTREGGEPTPDHLLLAIDGKEVGQELLAGDHRFLKALAAPPEGGQRRKDK